MTRRFPARAGRMAPAPAYRRSSGPDSRLPRAGPWARLCIQAASTVPAAVTTAAVVTGSMIRSLFLPASFSP